MKRILFVSLVFFMAFIVTGCGDKKVLTCNGTKNGSGVKGVITSKYTFVKDKLSKSTVEIKYKDFDQTVISTAWDTVKEQIKEQQPELNKNGLSRTLKFDDNKHEITLKLEIDFEKVSQEDYLEYASEDYRNITYDELKAELSKEEGITCK